MIPSIDDRLDSVMRALQEVILPALEPQQSLAIEQAHLSLAHLGLIRERLDEAPSFELDEAQTLTTLACRLIETAGGGKSTLSAAMALGSTVEGAALDSPAAVRRATHAVGSASDALIPASLEAGSEAFRASSLEQVLASDRASAMANRRWNLAAGFEPPDVGGPDAGAPVGAS